VNVIIATPMSNNVQTDVLCVYNPASDPAPGTYETLTSTAGSTPGRPTSAERFGWPNGRLGAWGTMPAERRFAPFQGINSSAAIARMAAERLSGRR
jgi:hypothetical protein